MSCVPSLKVKKFAKLYTKIIKKLGSSHFNDEIKFIVMKLIEHSIKTNGVDETASFVYNFFPNTVVEKILVHLDEPLCKVGCPKIEILTDENFDEKVDTNQSKWLIKFYSNKCSHCNDFAPIWKKVPGAIGNIDIQIGEVSLESGSSIFKRYNIESTPSIVWLHEDDIQIFVNGSFNLYNVLDFVEHPETYNDRTDDEIDCSNIIKHLKKVFAMSFVDKNYLRNHLRFQNGSINVESVLVKLSDARSR
jgi:thioredoxin-related protein